MLRCPLCAALLEPTCKYRKAGVSPIAKCCIDKENKVIYKTDLKTSSRALGRAAAEAFLEGGAAEAGDCRL